MFDEDFGDDTDYKTWAIDQENRRQHSSVDGWIYIGTYVGTVGGRHMTKVGLTTRKLRTRATSSHNPFYLLLCAFKVKEGVSETQVHAIESAVIRMLEKQYERIPHTMTRRMSEWFYAHPLDVMHEVNELLGREYSRAMHGYYCQERELQVIYGWENGFYLDGIPNRPYIARDLSNPQPAFECFMPGGCNDCDCEIW